MSSLGSGRKKFGYLDVAKDKLIKEKRVYIFTFDITMAQDRSTGVVRWFNDQKGFRFITPNKGSEDLFVHQLSNKSDGFLKPIQRGRRWSFRSRLGKMGGQRLWRFLGLTDLPFREARETATMAVEEEATGVVDLGAGGEVIGVVMVVVVVVWLVTTVVIMNTWLGIALSKAATL